MNSITTKQFISCLYIHKFSINDLSHLLESKHQNLVEIFQAIRTHPQYCFVAKKLLQTMLTNIYKMVSEKLEVHIIRNIWKKEFLDLLIMDYKQGNNSQNDKRQKQSNNKSFQRITDLLNNVFIFLCQKMRSLKLMTRISALQSFQQLIYNVIDLYNSSIHQSQYKNADRLKFQNINIQYAQIYERILIKSLKPMLKKQELVKTVSYNQGLFLQLLEDEFHQIRVKTLAILELISLKSPLFFSVQHSKYSSYEQIVSQTSNALKQTILYMLNDEHELVRQRSLVAIYRISQASLSKSSQQVFYPLTKQQIFTILMCLKQNNMILRQKVYQCLKYIKLCNIQQLFLILQKLYQTLLIYKQQDKVKIYLLLKQYSKTQKTTIQTYLMQNASTNIIQFYQYNYQQQQNCKNIVYKGKIILLREIINDFVRNKNHYLRNILPKYIIRHLAYVEDFELKLNLASNREVSDKDKDKDVNSSSTQEQNVEDSRIQMLCQLVTISNQCQLNQITEIVQKLDKIKSIIQLQFTLIPQKSFNFYLFSIIKEFSVLLKDYFNNRYLSDSSNPNNIQQSNLKSIRQLIWGKSCQKLNQVTASKPSITKKLTTLKFKIQQLKFIYNLQDCSNSHKMENFYRFNQIKTLLSSFYSLSRIISINKEQNNVITQTFDLIKKIQHYMNHFTQNNQLKGSKFKIRPISVGRLMMGQGYNDYLLVMIQYPFSIHQKSQYKFHNKNLWIKLNIIKNQFDRNKNNFVQNINKTFTYYIKFKDLHVVNDNRPLIDYNEKKTTFSAQLKLKVLDSKLSDINSLREQTISKNIEAQKDYKPVQNLNTKFQQSNMQKYKKLISKQLIIKDAYLIFAYPLEQQIEQNQQIEQKSDMNKFNPRGQKSNKMKIQVEDSQKMELEQQYKRGNKDFMAKSMSRSINQSILAEWHRFSSQQSV